MGYLFESAFKDLLQAPLGNLLQSPVDIRAEICRGILSFFVFYPIFSFFLSSRSVSWIVLVFAFKRIRKRGKRTRKRKGESDKSSSEFLRGVLKSLFEESRRKFLREILVYRILEETLSKI